MAIGLVSKRNVGMGKLSIFQCQIYHQGPPSLSVSVWYQPPLQAWSCKVLVCSVKSLNKTKTNLTCCAFHVAVIRRRSALITWHFFPDSQCCQYWLVGLSRAHCRSRMSCRLDRLSAGWCGHILSTSEAGKQANELYTSLKTQPAADTGSRC